MARRPSSWVGPIARSLVSCAALCAVASHAEDRVAAARKSKSAAIAALFQKAGVAYPPGEIYLRGFKLERQLELWAGRRGQPLALVKSYPICASSGELGPKRKEGDLQVPEGFYAVSLFQPKSSFHLALGIDYPNASDKILSDRGHPGGDIMIHGNCVTVGCIPLEDDPIEEVYLVAWDARANGQAQIPVHLFPSRLDDEVGMKSLAERVGDASPLLAFWRTLQPAYLSFEKTHRPPRVRVDPKSGQYRVEQRG